MMKFTMNKAKDGVKFPVLQQPINNQNHNMLKKIEQSKKLHHMEYYKHQKEIYQSRQAQLQQEQLQAQERLQ